MFVLPDPSYSVCSCLIFTGMQSILHSIHFWGTSMQNKGLPWWLSGKGSAYNSGDFGFNPWVRKIPWRRKWQPHTVFVPGKSHGQRSMVGSMSPWSLKKSWMWLKWLNKISSSNMLNKALFWGRIMADQSELVGTQRTHTAKSHESCPTLCNPTDSSPPGCPISGILQARTLEWVAVSFSNAWKWKVKVKSLSRVRLLATPWTAAYQAPLSMGFSRQEYWSRVPLPSPGLQPTGQQKVE